jgi:cytochrome b pre-mRNA-processing protein 3
MAESPLGKLIKKTLGGPDDRELVAQKLYGALVAQARRPEFYAHYGVPDSVDGRFEMVALHAFLLFQRLKDQGAKSAAVSQAVYDTMFRDMDASVRELGAGDLGVGKRVKYMTEAMGGRTKAYEAALAGGSGDLESALRRNLFGTTEPMGESITRMAEYVRSAKAKLAGQPIDAMMKGAVYFPAVGQAQSDY